MSIMNMSNIIVITARKCGDKVQPHIKVGNVYTIKEAGATKAGEKALVCCDKAGKEYRLNAGRFDWQITSPEQIKLAGDAVYKFYRDKLAAAKEKEFKDGCKKSFQELKANFTDDEHMKIAFTPLLIAEVAWSYAFACDDYCVEHRLSEVKSLSRALRHIRKEYLDFLRIDLRQQTIDHIKAKTLEFMEVSPLANNLTLATYTLNNAYLREYPEIDLLPLRVNATIARIAIRAYSWHVDNVNKLLASRLHQKGNSVANPIITEKLDACMDAFIGDNDLHDIPVEVKRIEAIFHNAIKLSDLSI